MANQRTRGRSAPRRALIGPLVMLAGGMVVGVALWRVLMDEPPRASTLGVNASEQLSHQDSRALDHLLTEHRAHQ
jgi:hypothetical protein